MQGRLFSVAAVFVLPALLAGCGGSSAPPPDSATVSAPETTAASGTVTIEIVQGDNAQTLTVENITAGTTVETVMRSITDVPVTVRGSGTTAFVDRIGDQATSGSEGWTYKVDGEFANQGIGTTELTPPATLTWSFGDEVPSLEP